VAAQPPADMAVLARLYHAVLSAFVREGHAPHYTELAHRLSLPPEEARLALHRLAGLGLPIWLHPGTDLLASFAPFSNLPTQYLVSVDGARRWFGQCGLEALAISWLYPGREVRIEAACLDCGAPLSVRMRDGAIVEASPETIVGHVNLPLRHWRDSWPAT
jgi:Alkylmercury lyase